MNEEKQPAPDSPDFCTETVEMLWKSGRFSERKFGFSLRIWQFAQDFVKLPHKTRKYIIYC